MMRAPLLQPIPVADVCFPLLAAEYGQPGQSAACRQHAGSDAVQMHYAYEHKPSVCHVLGMKAQRNSGNHANAETIAARTWSTNRALNAFISRSLASTTHCSCSSSSLAADASSRSLSSSSMVLLVCAECVKIKSSAHRVMYNKCCCLLDTLMSALVLGDRLQSSSAQPFVWSSCMTDLEPCTVQPGTWLAPALSTTKPGSNAPISTEQVNDERSMLDIIVQAYTTTYKFTSADHCACCPMLPLHDARSPPHGPLLPYVVMCA